MTRREEYTKSVEQAKQNYQDVQQRGAAAVGGDALAFMDSVLTPTERAESNLQAALIGELVEARQKQGISQKKLEALSGVKQPVIARMEKGVTSPQLSTILKVLAPLGKTLAIVPLSSVRHE